MKLQDTIEAIAYGVTELHSKATQDAFWAGYWDGYNDGEHDAFDCLDTDQGDEEPFLSEDFSQFSVSATARQTAEQDAEEQETLSAAADAYYDPFTRDVDYDGFLKDLPKAEGPKGFKVGDRVRITEAYGDVELTGAEASVISISDTYITLDEVGEITPFLVLPGEIELATPQQEQIGPGMKVRVKRFDIADSAQVFERIGYVIQVVDVANEGQTALVGFPAEAGQYQGSIQRTDNSYTFTWWLHPEALEVVA